MHLCWYPTSSGGGKQASQIHDMLHLLHKADLDTSYTHGVRRCVCSVACSQTARITIAQPINLRVQEQFEIVY